MVDAVVATGERSKDDLFQALQVLAEEVGKLNQRLSNVEEVLQNHAQEADAHHPAFINKKK